MIECISNRRDIFASGFQVFVSKRFVFTGVIILVMNRNGNFKFENRPQRFRTLRVDEEVDHVPVVSYQRTNLSIYLLNSDDIYKSFEIRNCETDRFSNFYIYFILVLMSDILLYFMTE